MSVKNPNDTSELPPITTQASPRSKFTHQNLYDLNSVEKAYLSPLATIALIDLNAFYAQVEQVRLNIPDEKPLVCCQWHAIIAVNYPARKFGISRLDSVKSALEKCPHLIVAHAAVYKKGETHWAYQPGYPSVATHKVSLDTYRRESRKIIRILSQKVDLVEKSSIDESYVDLGRLVYARLFELFPDLLTSDQSGELELPIIPEVLPREIQWQGLIYNSTAEGDNGPLIISDWDDICSIIGSQIIFDLRMDIYKQLGYTTSAGLARNKLVAKLGGGFKKPDNQTIIRNSSIYNFFNNFQLTDITGMGGKLGDALIYKFDIPHDENSISFIRENYQDLELLKDEIKDSFDDYELAKKIYHLVRGSFPTELSNQTEVKSMTSTKNFNIDYVRNLNDAYGWLTVFAGDLYNRLIDLDNENMELSLVKHSNKLKGSIRRPRTLTLGVFPVTGSRQTRQMPIPFQKDLEKVRDILIKHSHQLIREYLELNTNVTLLNQRKPVKELFQMNAKFVKTLSIQNMSLTISNFTVINDNSSIESFVKRDENYNNELIEINKRKMSPSPIQSPKKPKHLSDEDKLHIQKMFQQFEKTNQVQKLEKSKSDKSQIQKMFQDFKPQHVEKNKPKIDIFQSLKKNPSLLEEMKLTSKCPKCKISIDDPIEHNDYHIAIDLSQRLNN